LFLYRNRYGSDGADRFLNLLLFNIICLSLGLPSSWFLVLTAFHLNLAYCTTGLLKLLNPEWRRGIALETLLESGKLGSLASFLKGRLALQRILSACIMFFEITFPLSVLDK